MSLYSEWKSGFERPVFKWEHYLPIYEKHFSKFVNTDVTVFEIGVFHGGSLQMWERYFGPRCKIVGIDIDPACKKFEERNINVEIGDQTDINFLNQVIQKHGLPDVVIDDGSHMLKDMVTTLDFFNSKMPKNSVYLIEDCHAVYTSNWGGHPTAKDSIFDWVREKMNTMHKPYIEELKIDGSKIIPVGLHVYDSIVAIDYGLEKSFNAYEIQANSSSRTIETITPEFFHQFNIK